MQLNLPPSNSAPTNVSKSDDSKNKDLLIFGGGLLLLLILTGIIGGREKVGR